MVPCAPVATRRFFTSRNIQCLRRILLCAWSTRQRICFLIRRAPCFASSRATSARCRVDRALLSRTGSSSYAIRASGSSAYVDSLTNKLRHRSHPRRCAAARSPTSVGAIGSMSQASVTDSWWAASHSRAAIYDRHFNFEVPLLSVRRLSTPCGMVRRSAGLTKTSFAPADEDYASAVQSR